MTRRELLASAAGAALTPAAAAPSSRFRKGICSIIFPNDMPFAEKCRQARAAGYEGIEIRINGDLQLDDPPDVFKRAADDAQKAGVEVVSLWASEPLGKYPLNSPDPAVRERGVDAVRKCIGCARDLRCGAMLLVPGRLGSGPKMMATYDETWSRITTEMKKVIPDAARAKVLLTPENVSNKFLVSSRDMRDFVDQFKSPWVGVHFDTGNIMQWGYPQDWILGLGSRIKRIHAKDFRLSTRARPGGSADLLEGDVDWKATMDALVKVGYQGFIAPEIGRDPNNPEKINEVSRALDKILALA